MADLRVYQIFYDDATRAKLDPGFLPLDNSANDRPDWYELWPMRKFLHATTLEEGTWYGFFSTSLWAKTGIKAPNVFDLVGKVEAQSDVVLLSPGWDQIAYFRNVFEQGDIFHPGLVDVAQDFVTHQGIPLDLRTLVTHSLSSVFSNYVVARGTYWRKWLELADALFEHTEGPEGERLASNTKYRGAAVAMKAFVQERLPAIVLAREKFRVAAYDPSAIAPVALMVEDTAKTRLQLRRCDELKRLYCASGVQDYLDSYYALRSAIPLIRAIPGLNAPRQPSQPKS